MQINRLAKSIIEELIANKKRISVAESCTGGLVAAALTSIPGSSACFDYGVVTYSNEAKKTFLQVPETILNAYGAVSEQTALKMAEGVAAIRQTDMALATTGIAGPGGGSKQKPVGLVYISCFYCGNVIGKECHFEGNREEIRLQSVQTVLQLALDTLTLNQVRS